MKYVIFIALLILITACGKGNEKNKCMTLEQVRALCLAEAITNKDPSPWMVPYHEIDCERLYPVQQCFKKQDRYYTYPY